MKQLERIVGQVRSEHAADRHAAVFDLRIARTETGLRLTGETTVPEAVTEVISRAAAEGLGDLRDDVLRLPDVSLGPDRHALVIAALAPVLSHPRSDGVQTSQYVLGHRLELLSRHRRWLRIRGEDGYIGWVHDGYLALGPASWALAWERADAGEPVVSLGAELLDEAERVLARLPWGARAIRDAPGRLRLPDGRQGALGAGEIVDADRLVDRFPPRADSVGRTARRWVGAPYVWGGVTLGGVDCSGFVQSVFWMHGVALPRDAAVQATVGEAVDAGSDFRGLRAGDLLFFAEESRRVTHAALSLGGPHILHAAISNGGVDSNDLSGDRDLERYLRKHYVSARRLLPD